MSLTPLRFLTFCQDLLSEAMIKNSPDRRWHFQRIMNFTEMAGILEIRVDAENSEVPNAAIHVRRVEQSPKVFLQGMFQANGCELPFSVADDASDMETTLRGLTQRWGSVLFPVASTSESTGPGKERRSSSTGPKSRRRTTS